ncbi:MAG TPA: hypothetical protein VGI92_08120 [Gemmatimonadales bacterium]|jgi:photosystem II stability/assembly factor-like uncharacterized protein
MTSRRDFLVTTGLAGAVLSGIRLPRQGATAPGDLASRFRAGDTALGLDWRLLGPFRGGRTDAVCGVQGRPNEFYFGHVNGGVWKTIDAGRTWLPVFDGQPVASVGALAVAPSAPDVVYVGTGESTLRDSVGFGNGVYKSTDAGGTWTHLGLDETQHIGKVAVDPHNPDIVFVAAIGHLYAPNPDRGVFRSRDGGRSWQKVLFTNENVGAVEVVIDPSNPRIVYAGLWNTRRPPWYSYAPTNGPGGGIHKSTDGGTTWRQLTNGLPAAGIGRSGIAVAPSNPRRMYAVVDCLVLDPTAPASPPPAAGRPPAAPPGQGGIFRSDDGGETWRRVAKDNALWGRGWYFEKIAVDPHDADTIYVPNVAVNRSRDGGETWDVIRGSPGGDDYHQTWVSPDDPNTLIQASDQGTIITRNARSADPRAITWSSWLNQPTAQIYHASVDYRFPYWVVGAQQDSGSVAVRSRGRFAQISQRDWEPIGAGGESGYATGDPLHPGIIYGGEGTRWNLDTNVSVPGTSAPRGSETNRADWTQPLVISPADPRALYYASQFLFKSNDGSRTWRQISGDLTRPDPGVPANLDEAAAAQLDRNGKRGVIYAVSPSPLRAPLIWIGTDDGLIQLTSDDGQNWRDVAPAALTPWSRVTCIEASHFDADSAYASVDRHQLQDFAPYLFRSKDQGRSWQAIAAGLPDGAYVHVIKEDTVRRGLLFAGTERGAFVSLDDGDHWQTLQHNLPVTSVRDFVVYGNDLIVATHGRGFWVMDDISALRQVGDAVLNAEAYLFKPADAINVLQGGDNGTPLQRDEPQTPNLPEGAFIDYYLKGAMAGGIKLEILDDAGHVLRTWPAELDADAGRAARGAGAGGGGANAAPGIPRVSPLWQPVPEVFETGPGMHRVVWRPVAPVPAGGPGGGGGGGGRRPPTLLTGTFTARLTAQGQVTTQTFSVRPDPRSR